MTPNDYVAIVADAVRQEQGGKVSLLGIFADGRIFLPEKTVFPARMPLAFYFMFVDGEGTFDGRFSIKSPTGKVLDEPLPSQVKPANRPHTTLVNITSFEFSQWGSYEAVVTLDGRAYVRTFNVEPAPLAALQGAGVQ